MHHRTPITPIALIAIGWSLLGAELGWADDVPLAINFQGRLLNNAGSPLPGPADIDVGIWDAETSPPFADPLYAERHDDVALRNGVFGVAIGGGTVIFGTFNASTFQAGERWLEVTVNGDTLSPRQRFNSVPYSLRTQPTGVPLFRVTFAGCIEDVGTLTVAPVCITVPCGPPGFFIVCTDQCVPVGAPQVCPHELLGHLISP